MNVIDYYKGILIPVIVIALLEAWIYLRNRNGKKRLTKSQYQFMQFPIVLGVIGLIFPGVVNAAGEAAGKAAEPLISTFLGFGLVAMWILALTSLLYYFLILNWIEAGKLAAEIDNFKKNKSKDNEEKDK